MYQMSHKFKILCGISMISLILIFNLFYDMNNWVWDRFIDWDFQASKLRVLIVLSIDSMRLGYFKLLAINLGIKVDSEIQIISLIFSL